MQTEEQIIKEAYRKVSDDVKHIIASSEWMKRVKEIGQKYSLTDTQIDALGYEVLFVFLNIQEAELLNETIEEELEISSILAEQIRDEIEERIFSWAVKKIEQKNSQPNTTNSLDIPPPNLPGEIIGEESVPEEKSIFTFKTTPTQQPTQPNQQTPPQKPSFISQKLSQPTNPTTPNQDIPKTYTIDPYREPIE